MAKRRSKGIPPVTDLWTRREQLRCVNAFQNCLADIHELQVMLIKAKQELTCKLREIRRIYGARDDRTELQQATDG